MIYVRNKPGKEKKDQAPLLHYKVIFRLRTPITSDTGRGIYCLLTPMQLYLAARFGYNDRPLILFKQTAAI